MPVLTGFLEPSEIQGGERIFSFKLRTMKMNTVLYKKFLFRFINHQGFFSLLISIFFLATHFSNGQTYAWAKSIHSEGFDQAYDIVTDPQGYVYVAGQIEYLANFGSGVMIESFGKHDIFIAKYTPEGRLVWAKGAGGKGGDKAHSIALDGLGNLFIGGEFEDTAYFDNITKITRVIETNNMFVAKYDTSGTVQWVRNISIGTLLQTRGYAVTCDAQGNVYTCGGTKGDTYYENTFLFTSAGDYDATVVKFDAAGNLVWAKRMGGPESDKAYGIMSDNNGFIYVTGYFVGLAEFAPGLSLTGRGGTDIFLAKFDTSGLLQWVEQAGDTGFERGWDITQNVNGEILLTGEFQGHSEFGANTIFSNGNYDMFLASYNSSGVNLWALSGGGPEDDIGRGVTHDDSGNVFVIGDYGGSATFPPASISGNGFSEVFLVSYDATGSSMRWLRSIGGYENDRGRGVAADPNGNIYICGEYVDSVQFAATTLHGDSLLDMFVAKVVSGNFCSTQVSLSGQIVCPGVCDGSILATATGVSPFSYSWDTNPVQVGAVLNNLCTGTYSVTSTDAVGCTASASITLVNPAATVITPSSSDATCFGICDGSVSISANGNGPFSYSWNTSPIQTTSSISGLCDGNYSVIITNADGCTSSTSIVVHEPSQIQINTGKSDPACFAACDGIAGVIPSGNGPFTYSWNTSPVQSTDTLYALCDGSYTATIMDANGCSTTATVVLTEPSQLLISTAKTDPSCVGACDGTALANSNGQGTITYAWSGTGGQTGATLTSLCDGVYTVTCTDAAMCSNSSTLTINDPAPLQIQSTISNSTCIACADGSVDVQASGGSGTLQFNWSNGTSSEDLLNVLAGNYTLCVSDNNSCMLCDTFDILAPGTGIQNLNFNEEILVYPNPFSSQITILLKNAASEKITVLLYNSLVELVYEDQFYGKEFISAFPDLSNGLYFLHLRGAEGESKKVIPVLFEK